MRPPACVRDMGLHPSPRPRFGCLPWSPGLVRLVINASSKGALTWQDTSERPVGPNVSRHATNALSFANSASMSLFS